MVKPGEFRRATEEEIIKDAETKSGSPEPPALVGVIDGAEMKKSIKIVHVQSTIIDFLIGNKIEFEADIDLIKPEDWQAIKNIVDGYAWLIDLMLSDEETDGVAAGALEEYEDAFKRQKVEAIIKKRDAKFEMIKDIKDTIDKLNAKIVRIKLDDIPLIEKEIADAENEYNIKIVEGDNPYA